MTRCYEVSGKRFVLTAINSRTLFNRENNVVIPCRDEELFDSIKQGDFVAVDDNGSASFVIPKRRYIMGGYKLGAEAVKLYK